jgi:hypothetical protein
MEKRYFLHRLGIILMLNAASFLQVPRVKVSNFPVDLLQPLRQ